MKLNINKTYFKKCTLQHPSSFSGLRFLTIFLNNFSFQFLKNQPQVTYINKTINSEKNPHRFARKSMIIPVYFIVAVCLPKDLFTNPLEWTQFLDEYSHCCTIVCISIHFALKKRRQAGKHAACLYQSRINNFGYLCV